MVTELAEPQTFTELDRILAKYADEPGCLIQVLHEAQQKIGYLPEEVQEYIADGLAISPGEVNGVVSFYSFFSTVPRGRHTIKVCMGTACYVRGGSRVLEKVQEELGIGVGETTSDKRFSLDVVRCLGACGLSPVLTVDEKVFERVKPGLLGNILESYE
jgi:NADH:ubiquinone oxidoreductase subunit E